MVSLVCKLAGLGQRPKGDNSFGGNADGSALRHNQKAGTRFPCSQVIAKVIEHGPAIMRHKDAALGRCTLQQFSIAEAVQSGLLRRRKVDAWLLLPNRLDDCEFKVVVCLEPQAQTWDSPCFAGAAARAFWMRSQRPGLASDIGMPFRSNSRSVSTRYLSISA